MTRRFFNGGLAAGTAACPTFLRARAARAGGVLLPSATFTFAAEDLPMKGHYRFEVRALECFGKKGGIA